MFQKTLYRIMTGFNLRCFFILTITVTLFSSTNTYILVNMLPNANLGHRLPHAAFLKQSHRRLLQTQNPNNPTGPNMTINVDFPAKIETLTPQQVTNISKGAGVDTSGDFQLVRPGQQTNRTTNQTTRSSTRPSNVTNPTVAPTNDINPNVSNAITSVGSSIGQANRTSNQTGNAVQASLSNASNLPSNMLNQTSTTPSISNATQISNVLASSSNATKTLPQYYPFPVEQLVQNADFMVANDFLKIRQKDYLSQNQILLVMVQSLANLTSNFKITIRGANGIYQTYISINADGSSYIGPARTLQVNRTVADPTSGKYSLLDRLLRLNYARLINSSNIVSAIQQSIPSVNSVFVFRYRVLLGQEYQFTAQVSDGLIVKVLSSVAINLPLPQNSRLFAQIPVWTSSNDYNIRICDVAVRKFMYYMYGSVRPKDFKIVNILNSIGDPITQSVYFMNYLIDDSFYETAVRFNVASRKATLEYFKKAIDTTTNPTQPTSEGFSPVDYLSVANSPAVYQMNMLAKSRYPDRLAHLPITTVQKGKSPQGRDTFRITYLGDNVLLRVAFNSS